MTGQEYASEGVLPYQRQIGKVSPWKTWDFGHISSFVPIILPVPPLTLAIPPTEITFQK